MAGNTTAPVQASAVDVAQQDAANGTPFGVNACWVFVRKALGYADPIPGYGSASQAWMQVKARGGTYTSQTPPAGVPVFWTGGSSGYGHVAISNGNGQVYTTDFDGASNKWVMDGKVHLASIDQINKASPSLHYAGWATEVNGKALPAITAGNTDAGASIQEIVGGAASGVGGVLKTGWDWVTDPIGSIENLFKAVFTSSIMLRLGAGLGGALIILLCVYRLSGLKAVPIPV